MVTLTLNGALEEAGRLEQSGHAVKAAKLYRTVLKSFPRNTPAFAGLSRVVASTTPNGKRAAPRPVLSRLEQANATTPVPAFLEMVNAALTEYPACPMLWNMRGHAQNAGGLRDDAEFSFRRAIALGPRYPMAYANLGLLLFFADRGPEALSILEDGLKVYPDFPATLMNIAMVSVLVGQVEEGQKYYRRLLEIRPKMGNAHRQLADIVRYEADDPHLAQMRDLAANGDLTPGDLAQLHFGLGKALGDIGDAAGAAEHLGLGNALQKKHLATDMARDRDLFARIRTIDAGLGAAKVDRVMVKQRPIFLLGMPRSGTSLVEQILAAHPKVTAGGELPFLGRMMEDELAKGTVFDKDVLTRLRNDYFARAAKRVGTARYFTDKMPHNFRWVGLIARAFPEAKIVHIHRDPRAVAWSNFKHFFVDPTGTLNYSWDLNDIAEHHALYRDLMGHWHKTHPGRILDFDYEQLTREQEPQTRALIDWLGLPWDDACLEPHKVKREVRTSSMQQVRKKVYQGSSKEWEKVAPYLGEAFANLPTTALTYKDQD